MFISNQQLKDITEKAEQGNIESQKILANYYWDNRKKGTISELFDCINNSIKWFSELSVQNDSEMYYKLGLAYFEAYLYGLQEIDQAIFWLTKSAINGYAEAQYKLACIYELQYNKDYNSSVMEKALWWYKAAARQNHSEALLELGLNSLNEDKEESIDYLRRAANLNNPRAQYHLARIYLNRETDREKAIELFKKSASNGFLDALDVLEELANTNETAKNAIFELANNGAESAMEIVGNWYSIGKITELDKEKAIYWHTKAAMKGNTKSQIYLANYYLFYDNENPKRFKLSEYYSKMCFSSGKCNRLKYYIDIYDNLNGRDIIEINNTSQLPLENIDKKRMGAVLIKPEINGNEESSSLYSINDYYNCKKVINGTLNNVDDVDEFRDNELDVFMQIYTTLGKKIAYDSVSTFFLCNDTDFYTSRNLLGGLLYEKSVCVGVAEILRNLLIEKNIECITVCSDVHQYNQVKINGKWYFVDLTNDIELIKQNKNLEYCLLSEDDLKRKDKRNFPLSKGVFKYESTHTYPQDVVLEKYWNIMKNIDDESKEIPSNKL